MSSVVKFWWNPFAGAKNASFASVGEEGSQDCTCLTPDAHAVFDRLHGCASVHTLSGEALWISEKCSGVYGRSCEALEHDQLKRLIEQSNEFDFTKCLTHCVSSRTESECEISIPVNSADIRLALRFTPLEPCGSERCRQMVLVTAQPVKNNVTVPASPEKSEFRTAPKMLDLVSFTRSSLTRFSKRKGVVTELNIFGEEADIPLVNTDPIVAGMLVEQLLEQASGTPGESNEIVVNLERRARSIRLNFGCRKLSENRLPSSSGPVEDTPLMLAKLLGAGLTWLNSGEKGAFAELVIPINAGISLPDPKSLFSEIIHIPRPANHNSTTNPIPRNLRTG